MAILFAFFFFLLLLLFLHSMRTAPSNGPRNYPILGCLLSFSANKHRLLDWYTHLLAQSKSQTIVIRRLGAQRTLVTSNPNNVEHILKTNFQNYPKGHTLTEHLGDLLGAGILNADGELWRTQRKLASYELTARKIREFVEVILQSEVNERLLPLLSSASEEGRVVDMQDLLRRFAFDAISRFALGLDPGCLEPTLPESDFAEAFEVAGTITARRGAAVLPAVWKLKRALGIGTERVLREKVETIRSCVELMIRKRSREISDGRSGHDFLSKLVSAGHEEEAVRDMVISLVMAGRDTTPAALTWLFWVLCRKPHIEEDVVREVTALPNSYESLKKMPMLEACILETMRLYPPVAWDSKHAAGRDTLPDGTTVERGDRVTYFPYGMGRMENLWGETAGDFDPRRWLENKGGVSAFKYPVFQAGPRVCLGKEMALMQMKYVAAAVLRNFRMRDVREEPPVFVPLLTAHMAGGLRVVLSARERSQ